MQIDYHKKFKKALCRQPVKTQNKFFEIFKLFLQDQFDASLNNHALSGKLKGVRSFNVTGDVRVHYKTTKNGVKNSLKWA